MGELFNEIDISMRVGSSEFANSVISDTPVGSARAEYWACGIRQANIDCHTLLSSYMDRRAADFPALLGPMRAVSP